VEYSFAAQALQLSISTHKKPYTSNWLAFFPLDFSRQRCLLSLPLKYPGL